MSEQTQKIERFTMKVNDHNGHFLTLVDLWNVKGKIEISAVTDKDSVVRVGEMQISFGHDCTRFQVNM